MVYFFIVVFSSYSRAADFSITRQYVYPIVVINNKTNAIVVSGSAVVIKNQYLLSVAHVAPQKNQTAYVIKNGKTIKLTVAAIDKQDDLIAFNGRISCPCAPFDPSVKLEPDTTVYADGYPLFYTYQMQILTKGLTQGNKDGNLFTTTTSAPGGSGGAIFAYIDNDYKLVGIVKGAAVINIGLPIFHFTQLQNWLIISSNQYTIQKFIEKIK